MAPVGKHVMVMPVTWQPVLPRHAVRAVRSHGQERDKYTWSPGQQHGARWGWMVAAGVGLQAALVAMLFYLVGA